MFGMSLQTQELFTYGAILAAIVLAVWYCRRS